MLHPLIGAVAQARTAELRRQAIADRTAETAARTHGPRAIGARTRSRLGFLLIETGLHLMSEPAAGTPE